MQGLVLLTIQSHFPKLKPPPCNVSDPTASCSQLSGGHKALLFIGLYTLAIGSGGLKAALPTHGADQFDEKDPKEATQMSSFFNSLLLALCVGGAISLTLLVWIQDNKGWDWGFGVSTLAIFLGVVIFVLGMPIYRFQTIDQGSSNAIVEILQVLFELSPSRLIKLIYIYIIYMSIIYY